MPSKEGRPYSADTLLVDPKWFSKVQTISDVSQVLNPIFYTRWEDTGDAEGANLKKEVDRHPELAGNPDYLRMLSRVLLMAAEYGFNSYKDFGRKNKFKEINLQVDMTDPRYALYIADYLANATILQEQAKTDLRSLIKTEKYPLDVTQQNRALRGYSIIAYGEPELASYIKNKDIPRALECMIDPNILRVRSYVLPDMKFHRKVAAIDFKMKDMFLPKNEFERDKLPQVVEAFGGICDAEKVFQGLTWPMSVSKIHPDSGSK